MKKTYFLLFALAFFSFTINAQITLEDDFESYSIGDISPQASHWRTWSNVNGGAEDADVVLDFANSGSQSMLIDGSGITDQLLLIPGTPTTGVHTVQWFMYIPTGKSGYFNMQASLSTGNWAQALMGGNVYFNCDGASGGSGGVTGVTDCSVFDAVFTYPEDEWFKVTCIYDTDAETWAMNINDVSQFVDYPFAFGSQAFFELAAIDFFSASANNEFYVDDVTTSTGILSINDAEFKSFTIYPNPVTDILNIKTRDAVNKVSVYNVLGKLVYTATPNALSPTVNMSAMKTGVYFVEVTIGNATKTVKVIR